MADYVEIDGQQVILPPECEHDMAKRAEAVAALLAPKATKTSTAKAKE